MSAVAATPHVHRAAGIDPRRIPEHVVVVTAEAHRTEGTWSLEPHHRAAAVRRTDQHMAVGHRRELLAMFSERERRHVVDLAACRPGAITEIPGEHPNGSPHVVSKRRAVLACI